MNSDFYVVELGELRKGSHFRAKVLRGDETAAPIDPFIGVDHAWVNAPTFPPHPHAGFSAVSYVFEDSETGILNRDSLGTRNLILPGGLHWMASGRGIVHEEVPIEAGKTNHMLQIFVNLAAEQQQLDPFSLSLRPEDVPVERMSGARIRVPLGRLFDRASPLTPPTDVCLFDVSLDEGARVELPVPDGMAAFVVPVRGVMDIGGATFDSDLLSVPVLAAEAERRVVVLATHGGPAQAVMFAGKPLRQHVYWQGSIAMASPVALRCAVEAFKQGKFGSVD